MKKTLHESFWPLAHFKRMLGEESWQVLRLVYGWNFEPDNPQGRRRLWILPLWFSGRAATGEKYAALFPLGGVIREFLGRDRIEFWLFPIFLKHHVNQVKSRNWLWPVFFAHPRQRHRALAGVPVRRGEPISRRLEEALRPLAVLDFSRIPVR